MSEAITSTAGGWQPVNQNHAIDVMAAAVSFDAPLPDRVYRRFVDTVETQAFSMGLKSRHIAPTMRLDVGRDGEPVAKATPVAGRVYNSIVEGGVSERSLTRISEQIQVDPGSIVYRTWSYVSWKWQYDRIIAALTKPLEIAVAVVSISAVRLEYLDRFWFAGESKNAKADQLLREDTDLVAPHIFKAEDLWHSHTGAFLAPSDQLKRVFQVHLDSLENPRSNTDQTPTRWTHIMTAREDRYPRSEDENAIGPLMKSFDDMHIELKDLLARTIRDEHVVRIHLQGQ